MPLARFAAVHDALESQCATIAIPTFAVVLARDIAGVVLVFNRFRKVWELPGGLIDPGESAREAAARELHEEAGCTARNLHWLGLVEVNDGTVHFGAVFGCEVEDTPASFQSDEIDAIDRWCGERHPSPLGESDAALLNRFG